MNTYNGRRLEHRAVRELVDHIDLEVIALQEVAEISICPNGPVHSTHLIARDERSGKLPVYDDSGTGEAIRRDVGVRDGQVGDGADRSACARKGETQGKKNRDGCTPAHGREGRRGRRCTRKRGD